MQPVRVIKGTHTSHLWEFLTAIKASSSFFLAVEKLKKSLTVALSFHTTKPIAPELVG